jgi:four helix bundle protein
MEESPLYVKAYDLLLWLLPQAQKFPRAYRFTLAEHIQRCALQFNDLLVAAGKSKQPQRLERLRQADVQLEQLRVWLRLARDLQLISIRQFEHAARLMAEVGRLLGSWLISLSS